MQPPPAFIEHRQKLWDKLIKERNDWVAAQEQVPIKIVLPDGSQKDGQAWKTTPYDIAVGIRYVSNFLFILHVIMIV